MKLPIFIFSCLAALPVIASDPPAFSPEPFRLEPSTPPRNHQDDILTYLQPPGREAPNRAGDGIRLDLPLGPVRVDYGIPVQKSGKGMAPRFNFKVDGPGPGYRELRDRRLNENRNS
jgi:hypothetical protein